MNNDSTKKFTQLNMRGVPLSQCEIIPLPNDTNDIYRLYVLKDEHDGFEAMAVRVVSCSNNYDSVWDCPELQVEIVFNVSAFYDGIRHLYVNPSNDSDGYLYYPNVKTLAEILTKLNELEIEICTCL